MYPKRVAKHAAKKAWSRLSEADQLAAVNALPLHCLEWQRRGDLTFTPHAATWLNGRRWEDELDAPKVIRPKVGSPEYYARFFES